MYQIRKLFNPILFQGERKIKDYFEGWYFKLIDASQQHVYALIPGISLGRTSSERHAFIQVLEAASQQTHYITFPYEQFQYNKTVFSISIGKNRFSRDGLFVDIEQEGLTLKGEITCINPIPFPSSFWYPNIMGPYTFVPGMECRHGIVNIHQDLEGSFQYQQNTISFDRGYGYVEKDWGTSFPEGWIWLQCNHFGDDNVSVMFSLAKIPWLGRYFWGFLSFIRIGKEFYRFATYTKATLDTFELGKNHCSISLSTTKESLSISASYKTGGVLKAPKLGMMERDIIESIQAIVEVSMTKRDGTLLYRGEGRQAGLEIVLDEKNHVKEIERQVGKKGRF